MKDLNKLTVNDECYILHNDRIQKCYILELRMYSFSKENGYILTTMKNDVNYVVMDSINGTMLSKSN